MDERRRFPSSQPPRYCADLAILAETTHYVISIDGSCRLIVARRTTAPYQEIVDIELCFRRIASALDPVPRAHYSLLVDSRIGPGRNDPAFEEALGRHRGKLLNGFAKNAALASTATGRLQIQRYAKIDGREVQVTDDPAVAFRYLGTALHVL